MSKSTTYKELSLQQLRSFRATARTLSFKRAAEALGLAHPTVWEQVHALQRHLGIVLIEPHRRGCRLTVDGAEFLQLIGPFVENADSLKRRFLESRQSASPQLSVASTPRTLIEDLPPALEAFAKTHPRVRMVLKEADTLDVVACVEAKEVDLGITVDRRAELRSTWLTFEPCYALEPMLLTRRDHPLAKRKRIRLRDLQDFPLVNGPETFPDPSIRAALEKLPLAKPELRQIHARTNQVTREYVRLGYGIGLVTGRSGLKANRDLHERSLSKYLGTIQVYAVSRKGDESAIRRAFVLQLQRQLG